ncbi:apoptosis antagonizing transcription factor-domain-containing protein [Gongronella butleri]|nr:apoptosis antagonizing transcription factor-domain-containing protein [Gongronella butleri]
MAKKKSLADQLADLDSTAPKDYDPEDLVEPMNDAGLSDDEAASNDEHDNRSHYVKVGKSSLRNKQPLLMDDPRYAGERASRKELYSDDDEDDDMAGYGDDDEVVPFGAVDDDEDEDEDEDDEDDSDNDDDDDSEGDFSDNVEEDQEDNELTEQLQKIQQEEKSMLQQLAKTASGDVEKGQHVRQQLTLWDNMLEARIRMQKVVENANRLPQFDRWDEVEQVKEEINDTKADLREVLDDLMDLRIGLLSSSGAVDVEELSYSTRKRHLDDDNEEIDDGYFDALWHDVSQVNDAFATYRNSTLEKWSNKVQASSAANLNKKFKAFDQNILTQIDNVMAEKDSLIKRTQLQRAEYTILGKTTESSPEQDDDEKDGVQDRKKASRYHDTYDKEIFDDNDFYQQQLRELIESRMVDNDDPIASGMRWAQSKKDQVKKKKVKVDTKASKGRKLKFNVHEKIQNFMAPIPEGQWHDGMIEELYSSLLGQHKPALDATDDLVV